MAILHEKGLQDLPHCNEGPDLRGSELAVHGSCSFILGSSPRTAEKKHE